MNALMKEPAPESARDGAARLFKGALQAGFAMRGRHRYVMPDGSELLRVVRLKHPHWETLSDAQRDQLKERHGCDGKGKIIRPIHRATDGRYIAKGPARPVTGWPLYVPPYPLVESDPVVYVEGEACADALAKLGVPSRTSLGGAQRANDTDWTAAPRQPAVVWPDHDKAGADYADAVTAALHAQGCTVELIDAKALGLPMKGDAVDWLEMHPDATAADVLALPRLTPTAPGTTTAAAWVSAPEPLRRALPPALDYPLAALGPLLGNAATRIHGVVQAPAGLCGQSVLAAASLAVQAHADVSISGSLEPLSLWHVTIGASGERKSAADKWALREHVEFERERTTIYRQQLADHEMDMSAWKAAERNASGKKGSDAEAIRSALYALGAAPEPPLLPWLLLSEPTMEGLHKAYQHGRPGIGLFNDDAGDFLGGHAMNKDNRTKSAASFSKLWDNGCFDRVRAGDGATKYHGRRLALHLMVQPVIAESVLSDDVLVGQGFLARCLLAWPASTIGTREYQDVDLTHDPDLARYWRRMRDLLDEAPPLQQGTRNELNPRVLTLTADAMAYWVEVKNAIEAAMLGDYAGIHAWASKGGSQVARIAGVLTMVENPDTGVIQREAVERASELVTYHLDEAARIVGTSSAPAKIKHAELLRDWCWATGRRLIYSTDVLHKGPNAIRTADTFTAAVEQLEATGWAAWVEGGKIIDGKHRARVWHIRPEGDA